MTPQDVIDRLPEASALLAEGRADDAVRLSGEILAQANALWTNAHNAGRADEAADALAAMLRAAVAHVNALSAIHANIDAYVTAVTTLWLAAQHEQSQLPDSDISKLELYSSALVSLLLTLQNLQPQGPQDIEHVQAISRYVASMLYYYYTKLIHDPEAHDALVNAYQILLQVKDTIPIDTPTIEVIGEPVDPSSPLPLFADLLGRSIAMGLLEP